MFNTFRWIVALPLALMCASSAFAADIGGAITNKTTVHANSDITASVHGIRVQQNDDNLVVTEILILVNASSPPRSLRKNKLFWLAFPHEATLISSTAQGPRGQILDANALPAPGEARCYFSLPLQPGSTKVQVQYRVPFRGKFTLVPHIPFPAESFGIVRTASLQFRSSEAGAYTPDSDQYGEIAEVIRNAPSGDAPAFTVSTLAGLTVGPHSLENDATRWAETSSRDSYLILLGLASVFAFTAWLIWLWRKHKRPIHKTGIPEAEPNLQDELFSLELARLENRISTRRYETSKAVLERRLRHHSRSQSLPDIPRGNCWRSLPVIGS